MVRLRSALDAPQSPPTAHSKRRALREKTNVTRPTIPVYEGDGKTEGFIKEARATRRPARGKKQNEHDLVMTGALGPNEAVLAKLPSDAPMTTEELLKDDAPISNAGKTNRRPPRMTRKPVQSVSQGKVLEGLKKRMQATARKEAGKQNAASSATEFSSDALPVKPVAARDLMSEAHERSEFSLSPSPPQTDKLNVVKNKRSSLTQPRSVVRVHGTPAVESSILALKNFKRRPRQPSMLQMVQQRTQSARPSTVNVTADEDPSVFDLDVDDDGDDAFAPDAEGTPLHVSRATAKTLGSGFEVQPERTASAVLHSRKRTSNDLNASSTALDALRAKRRKSGAPASTDVDQASVPKDVARRSSNGRHVSPEPPALSEVQVIHSSPESSVPAEAPMSPGHGSPLHPEVVIPSTEEGHGDINDLVHRDLDTRLAYDAASETMAEPASSSPQPADPLRESHADELADPVTQVTPPHPEPENPKRDKVKPISTATLQSLLPKRRRPLKPRSRKTEYDFSSDSENDDSPLDASHLEDDEDELGGRLRRRPKTTPAKGRKGTTTKPARHQSKAPRRSQKPAVTTPARKPVTPSTGKGATRTYGRRGASDKENDADADDFQPLDEDEDSALQEISMHEATQSTELEEAKRKFAEVDEWDMEFESMSVEDHRSSSQQWR